MEIPIINNITINVTQRLRNRFGNLHLHRNLVGQAEYLERGEIPPPMEASGAPVDLTLQSDQKVKVEIFNYGLFYKNIPVYVKAWKTMTISLNFTPSSSLLPFFHPEDFFNTTPSTPGFNQIAGVHLKHKYRTRTYPKESEFTGLQPMHLQHAAHQIYYMSDPRAINHLFRYSETDEGKSIAMIRKQTNAFIKIHDFSNSETKFQSNLKGAKLQMLSIKGLKEDIEIAELLILKKIRIWNALQNDN
ncbi:hypothetical protein C6P40_002633 [Pichia californica]|uniref:Uncharacterized protein n=1 Tax=Pichia californica TaxID=460514 RepID=A0A9P6WHU0_9ASCO|nr:hypothetical protein C6P40_002633 [[Candida] californica]